MALSRKNYIEIAATLRPLQDSGDITTRGIQHVAQYLASDNDRFDWGRFMDACGVEIKR